MSDLWFVRQMHRFYERWNEQFVDNVGPASLARSAVVFAPHQDDETLGCGGTILLKRIAGADVKIVFMTDGRTSHSHLIPADELTAIRQQEAIQAGQMLGVGLADLTFLGFRDGELGLAHKQAVDCVLEILQRVRPEEVFVPYRKDFQPDHISTNQIVLEALRSMQSKVTVYEYPVWFWYHWPWFRFPQETRHNSKNLVINTLRAGLGLQMLGNFCYAICVESVLEEKRAALNQHRSQMTRLIPNPDWPTLPDFSGGDFLACFFHKNEIFHRYQIG